MLRACIFDLDGTLLNTLPTIIYYLNTTLGRYGFSPVTEEQCRRYVGDGAYMLISRALSDRGEEREAVVLSVLDSYKSAYDSAPLYLTEPYEGVVEAINRLRAAGLRLGVLSNKPHSATRPIVESFFGGAFQTVRGAVDGTPLKPDPTSARLLASELGIDPSECAFIGDTDVDVFTGRNMGAGLSVGVSWGFRDADELMRAGADSVVGGAGELCDLLFKSL